MMQPKSKDKNSSSTKNATKLLRTAGIGYGLFVGLGFALFVWGYDGWHLAASSADMAWAKFWLGLPCALCIGAIAGFLGHKASNLILTLGIWIVTFVGLSWLAGHIPFEGLTWLAEQTDARFAHLPIYPYLPANEFRTRLVMTINGVLGLIAGYGEMLFVNWAWDRSTSNRKLSPNSWLVLSTATLIGLLPAISIHYLILQPLRTSSQQVAALINVALKGGLEAVQAEGKNTIEAKLYGARFSSEFTLYFVGFSRNTEDMYTSYADVVFQDGFTLRCIVVGTQVSFCEEYQKKLAIWMDDLIHVGLTGERRWLDDATKKFQPEEQIVQWMQAQQANLSDQYTLAVLAQKGNWRLIEAQFDTGFTMVCHFHGVEIVTVDHCEVSTP